VEVGIQPFIMIVTANGKGILEREERTAWALFFRCTLSESEWGWGWNKVFTEPTLGKTNHVLRRESASMKKKSCSCGQGGSRERKAAQSSWG